MIARDETAARAALAQLLGRDAERAGLELLRGGTHRRSWLVAATDGSRLVLRLPVARSNALLDIATEARAMEAAARAGVAPAVIAVDVERGLLLTEYRASAAWEPHDARRPANVARLAALLRALHTVPIDLPVFAAERIAQRYLAAAPLPAHEPLARPWADELIALARRYDAQYSPTAFCHNDLVAANVLDDGGGLALVDFEYSVRGSPLLDLANFAAMNGLGADEQRALLAAYNQHAPSATELTEFSSLVRMVRLFAWFWAWVGAAGADEGSAYARYLDELGADLQRD
jgi:aminoglycoside phosphotransferase (APT) family kinase protein